MVRITLGGKSDLFITVVRFRFDQENCIKLKYYRVRIFFKSTSIVMHGLAVKNSVYSDVDVVQLHFPKLPFTHLMNKTTKLSSDQG